MSEHQNIEYKQSWRDEYLKWICEFANAQGGKIYIGINDQGIVTGIHEFKKLMDDIPNKAINHLGLAIDVNLLKDNGREYIEIVVPISPMPISYHGTYHFRSGATKQELRGSALHEFLLRKIGRTWDDIGIGDAKIEDLDFKSINSFVKAAVKSGRIYKEAEKDNFPTLLENLQLVTPTGEIKAAAILLFGKNPKKFFVTSYFKIGKFGTSDADLKFQDTIEGNVFDMVEMVMTLLKQRYIVSTISYRGIQRIEKSEYPDAALREAILNAIVHKDYTDSTIQMSVYDHKITIWNPGRLSEDLSIEKLKHKHPSRARNKNIAEVFFKAGYIESWGRGIEKMMHSLKDHGLPEPIFEENSGGFQVTFLKEPYPKELLNRMGLNDRQINAITFLKDTLEITNAKYQEINNIGKSISAIELLELFEKGIISKIGKGKLIKYVLKN